MVDACIRILVLTGDALTGSFKLTLMNDQKPLIGRKFSLGVSWRFGDDLTVYREE